MPRPRYGSPLSILPMCQCEAPSNRITFIRQILDNLARFRGELCPLWDPPGACQHSEGDPRDQRQGEERGRGSQHRERLEIRGHGAGPHLSDHLLHVHHHRHHRRAGRRPACHCQVSFVIRICRQIVCVKIITLTKLLSSQHGRINI